MRKPVHGTTGRGNSLRTIAAGENLLTCYSHSISPRFCDEICFGKVSDLLTRMLLSGGPSFFIAPTSLPPMLWVPCRGQKLELMVVRC